MPLCSQRPDPLGTASQKSETKRRGRKLTQSHAHTNIHILHHLRELLERDLPIAIQIGLHYGLIDDLLQLLVLQVAPHHHLQHDEQLSVADVAVAVDVVDLEREAQLLLFVAFAAEGAQPADEFLEVYAAAAVFVEDRYHAGCQRVAADLREGEEFVALDCAGVVLLRLIFVSWSGLSRGGEEEEMRD